MNGKRATVRRPVHMAFMDRALTPARHPSHPSRRISKVRTVPARGHSSFDGLSRGKRMMYDKM